MTFLNRVKCVISDVESLLADMDNAEETPREEGELDLDELMLDSDTEQYALWEHLRDLKGAEESTLDSYISDYHVRINMLHQGTKVDDFILQELQLEKKYRSGERTRPIEEIIAKVGSVRNNLMEARNDLCKNSNSTRKGTPSGKITRGG